MPNRAVGARAKRLRYLWAALVCIGVTLLSMPLAAHFDRSNIVAIFILAVVLVGGALRPGPAALAAVLSVCAFDFFFVPPRFSFAVSDVQYLLTFCIMLAVGLITGQLTAGLRFQARVASHREERAGSLYEIARDLSAAVQVEQVVKISDESIQRTFRASAALLLPDAERAFDRDTPVTEAKRAAGGLAVEIGTAQWAFDRGQPAGFGTDTLPGSEVLYIPLRAPTQGARRAGRQGAQSALAAHSRAAPIARYLCGADRDCAWSGCTTSASPRTRCSKWNPSGCAIRCWRRCRMICARR